MSAPPSIGNLLLLTLTPLLLSCDGERAERGPPTARFDSTQLAEAIFEFDSAAFRDIEWTSQERAVDLGMPHWGITGLSRRDVDAVARYILGELRDPGP